MARARTPDSFKCPYCSMEVSIGTLLRLCMGRPGSWFPGPYAALTTALKREEASRLHIIDVSQAPPQVFATVAFLGNHGCVCMPVQDSDAANRLLYSSQTFILIGEHKDFASGYFTTALGRAFFQKGCKTWDVTHLWGLLHVYLATVL